MINTKRKRYSKKKKNVSRIKKSLKKKNRKTSKKYFKKGGGECENMLIDYTCFKGIFDGLDKIYIEDKEQTNITEKIVEKISAQRIDKLNEKVLKYGYSSENPEDFDLSKEIIDNKVHFYSTFDLFYQRLDSILKDPTYCRRDVKKWIDCNGKCFELSKSFMRAEVKSTLYHLILLGNSFISFDEKQNKMKFIFKGSIDKITGRWEEDMKYFNLHEDTFGNTEGENGRLIMGFGPSAAGKTYWAENIIKILNKLESGSSNKFPTKFLSIDGGIQRESCVSYQIIKYFAKKMCKPGEIVGFSNLMASGIKKMLGTSIFNSDNIKKEMANYLQIKTQPKPNLYVPHTLGECKISPRNLCKKLNYSIYTDITKDEKWVALLIWQHLEECPYKDNFKCVGCKNSGEAREIHEGKKYSSGSYKTSMKHGNEQLIKAPGNKIKIHNSGSKDNKSIVEANIEIDDEMKAQIQKNYKCEWIYEKTFLKEEECLKKTECKKG